MSALGAKILHVGAAGFRDAEPVQAEQRGESGMVVVESLGGEDQRTELAAVRAGPVRWLDFRPTDVLGGV